jgi:predicted nucleic acid-binding Zn ribbon protein
LKRRRTPRPVGFALDSLADELEPATLIARIQRRWPAVAGSFASCRPAFERDGELTVDCASSVQAQELDLMSELVVQRLNAALGQPAVKRLRPRARI